MKITRADGTRWQIIGAPTKTSDGFLLATGVMIDENGLDIADESGYPIIHSFFLGRA